MVPLAFVCCGLSTLQMVLLDRTQNNLPHVAHAWPAADIHIAFVPKHGAMGTIQHSHLSPNLPSKWPSLLTFGFSRGEVGQSQSPLSSKHRRCITSLGDGPIWLKMEDAPISPSWWGGSRGTITAIAKNSLLLN